ncbi:MFS transporter [Cupriavidus sp. YR651]|uniref:MFS transporter n=1 Tax=Cupriavidus sp. YR651 TaxID=1855315 RepID=UPI000B85D407|nr:MFS transporter [Cupriavidus sp. YR651]
MSTDIRSTIDESPMSTLQTIAVIACIVLNMLDGFDVLAMAFTAARLAQEWQLNGKELGLLLSAGLIGMGAGSILIAPLGDRFGRRKLILLCLCIIGSGMLLSAVTQDATQLAIARLYTGLGIGGMVASITVIAGEYASKKWRSTSIVMQHTGYAVGAAIGGVISAYLLSVLGWRSVFAFGGIATLLAIPMAYAALPESIDFLLTTRPADALARVNQTLARMKRAPISALPAATTNTIAANALEGWPALLKRPLLPRTLALWSAFFFVIGSYYFVASWTPKLLVEAGLSAAQGITGGVLLNLGGIAGSALFGLLATRLGLRPLLVVTLLGAAVLMVGFGASIASLKIGMAIAVLLGATLTASVAGLYALSLTVYPSQIRTTGIGFAAGIGRVGGMLSPIAVGVLLDTGWTVPNLYFLFLLPMAGAAIAVVTSPIRLPVPRDQRGPMVS